MSTIYGNAIILPSKDGAAKETWVLNERMSGHNVTYTIDFTSNGTRYSKLTISAFERSRLTYGDTLVYGKRGSQVSGWINQAYRKLTFDTSPAGALLTWLQANGIKQPDDTAVQDTKALTITSNGTVSVTPDAPYDALSSVDVTVNVASGGGGGAGFKVTFPATATNWNYVDQNFASIFLADGTTKSVKDYSTIGGKTIENVTGINIYGTVGSYVLRMTLSEGSIAQFQVNVGKNSYAITTDHNTTLTSFSAGRSIFWWPIADTVISAIEMYYEDL